MNNVTPMMAQYIEIKAAHADALLFYRMGDFYELFFADAEVASRALGITLTKRGKHLGDDIPMCGVPVHSAEEYLNKLIEQNYRVAICEQLEDPAQAKKRGGKAVVKRDVVRLVTPGTITEENLLKPGVANLLCTIASSKQSEGDESFAIASVDLAAGSFKITPTTKQNLITDVDRLSPKEIVVSENLYGEENFLQLFENLTCTIQPQPDILFDSSRAIEKIKEFFNLQTLESLGEFNRAELAAINGILSYLEKTQVNEKPNLARPSRESTNNIVFIDAATRANLEIIKTQQGESKGALLDIIDRTVSNSGKKLLHERLVSPSCDVALINNRLDEVAYFFNNDIARSELRQILKRQADMNHSATRLSLNRGNPRDMQTIMFGLASCDELITILQKLESLPKNIKANIKVLGQKPNGLLKNLSAALADNLPTSKTESGYIKQGFDTKIDELRKLNSQGHNIVGELESNYRAETGLKNLKIKNNNVLGTFIEIASNHGKVLQEHDKFIHRQSTANTMRYTTNELIDLENKITSAASEILQLEVEHFERLQDEIISHVDILQNLVRAFAALDVATALAELAHEQGYVRPKIDDSLEFSITAGRHPVVEQALRQNAQNPFVANDCNIGGTRGKMWLLTGPNMGGKSTFLRQNALIAVLAQMGSFVSAGEAHIGVIDRLFSRVGAADDLARGRSTFMVEMVETATILNQATERSLIILDEIGRGTATFDGLSIAWATLEHLHEINSSRTLFATHFHELTALSKKLEHMKNVTLSAKEWQGEVIFMHKIVEGRADRSYGIQVAKLAGLPPTVIERAKIVLAQLESHSQKNKTTAFVDELPLFTGAQASKPTTAQAPSQIESELKKINPDNLSPKDALEAIYNLRKLLRAKK